MLSEMSLELTINLFHRGSKSYQCLGYSEKILKIKVEWNSDIHILTVNGKDQEDLKVKVWAKLDTPFFSFWNFSKLYMDILKLATQL